MPAVLDLSTEAAWLAALAPAHAARLRRLREPRERAASLLGLALLVDCCRAAGLAPPVLARLDYPPRGKPSWPAGRDFSIAHDSRRCACALAPPGTAVGLDIEDRGSVSAQQLRLVASEPELARYRAAGLTAADLWVAKEAVAKAAGTGVGLVGRVLTTPTSAELDGRRYVIARPALAAGCAAALATAGDGAFVLSEVGGESLLAAGP